MLYESNTRITNHRFSPDMQTLFASERAGQNTVEFAVNLAEPATRYTLARYRTDDVYANPGSLVMVRGGAPGGGRGAGGGGGRGGVAGPGGGLVLLSADKASVFYQGSAYDKNPQEVGPKSFIDKVAIKTGEKQRVYESENTNVFERVASIIDIDSGKFIVSRESPTDVPQSYLLDAGKRTQLTQNKDYTPDLTRAVKQQFMVERPDGFKFKVKVTLPPTTRLGHGCRRCSGSTRRSSRPRTTTTARTAPSTRTRSRTSARARCTSSCGSATPSSSPTRRSSVRRGR